jgi:hypothetical protein
VQALGLNGLGCIKQQRYLRPPCFQHKPLSRLIAPGIQASQRNDDTRGRTLAPLSAYGVTALYSLSAAPAAHPLGLAPGLAHLDRTSFHGAGRSSRAEEPAEHGMPITRGDSRDQRPALNPVLLAWLVAPHAGRPVLRPPLRGPSREAQDCSPLITAHLAPLQSPSGTPCLGADRAL